MTVICYRSGVLAADGRVTEDNTIFSNKYDKVFRLKNGGLIGAAGDAGGDDLVEFFNKLKKQPTHKQLLALEFEFQAIWVKPDNTVWIVEVQRDKDLAKYISAIWEIKEPFTAVGSGASWAMGAMDRGANAEQAVKTAIKYDNQCGGKIQIYKLHQSEKVEA